MTASPLAQTPNDMFNAPIAEADPEIAEVLNAELSRQQNGLEMIASENFVPRAVLQAQGSVLTNKYAEGYPGRRYYGGCEQVDRIETIARERAKSLFGAEYVNVQPHSGAQANAAVYQALVKPGDTVLGLALDHGGHLTHGMKINFSGRFYHAEAYGVNPETFRIDPEIIRQRALETHPAMIIGGWSAYPRIEDFKAMKEIADEVGAKFWVDMAHFAGLVAAGTAPEPGPVRRCRILHGSQDSWRSAFRFHSRQAGLCQEAQLRGLPGSAGRSAHARHRRQGRRVQGRSLSGVQGPHAAHPRRCQDPRRTPHVRRCQEQRHQRPHRRHRRPPRHGDLRNSEMDGQQGEDLLAQCGITINRNTVPFDPRPASVASGLRIGTSALATRGFGNKEYEEVADIIGTALAAGKDADVEPSGFASTSSPKTSRCIRVSIRSTDSMSNNG